MTTVWTVTYVDDDKAEEIIDSRVFSTEAEAESWADKYRHRYAYVEKHEVPDTNRSAS